MSLPFDGAISNYLETGAPEDIRRAVRDADKRDILTPHYPYDRWMSKTDYQEQMDALQVELVKFQHWVKESGARIVILFEGRDGAGKGGAIGRFTLNLNPRVARVEALAKPSDDEAQQWYFQRYVERLPQRGRIVLFDRSWYNRGVVDHVFGFTTHEQRERFFEQLPAFEAMLVNEGMQLFKLWITVGRAEQLRRMVARESNVLKQWKLSSIDVEGLRRWDAYTAAIEETLRRGSFPFAPWTVIHGDDKYRARLAVIRHVLSLVDYAGKDTEVVGAPDPLICGGPDLWHA